MQSVLDQTYTDWLCFVLSNGNKNTVNAPNWSFDVIKNFAAKDSRFIVWNKKTNAVDIYIPMLYHLARSFPDSYICSLDADDVYQNDFFERAVALAEKHQLDIVACGTEIVLKQNVEAAEEILLSCRAVEESLIVKKEDFAQYFRQYKPFFNEMWGKLYRADLFDDRHDETYARKNMFYRFLPDTLFTVDNLSRSKAIGILSGTSHKFYQFQQRSMSNATIMTNADAANRGSLRKWKNRGKYSVYTTYETIISFLNAHGGIDDELYEYMQAVLFGWFGDFYSRTLLLTTNEAKLAKHVECLVFNPKFDELMYFQGSGQYHNLKDRRQRKIFCEKLKYLLIGQKAVKNRRSLIMNGLECTARTRKKIDRITEKLDNTIWRLSQYDEE